MKKTTIISAALLLTCNTLFGQQKILVSASSGLTLTGSEQKSNEQGNGYNLQADAYLPLYRKGWDGTVKGSGTKGRSFSAGLFISANYTSLKNLKPGVEVLGEKYQILGGTVNVTNGAQEKRSGGFSGVAGLQSQFLFGSFSISPILSAGYLSIKQAGHTRTGNFNVNGQAQMKDLVIQDATKTSGFIIKPQIKFGYALSAALQVYISSALTTGAQTEYTVNTLVPQGGFNDRNTYDLKQLQDGTYAQSISKNNYSVKEINVGISIGLGRSISEKGVKRSAPLSDDNDLAAAMPGNPIGGIIVKGGKNPGGNMLHTVTDNNGEITFTINEPGDYILRFTMPEANDSAVINERRRVEVLKSNKTGDPNKRIVNNTLYKCDYCGEYFETDDKMLEHQATCKKANPNNKSISSKGVAANSSNKRTGTGRGKATLKDMTITKMSAMPGTPIGGIVVKGGKNPGGNLHLITNENGEVTFTVTEAGVFTFAITTKETPNKKNQKQKKDKPIKGIKDTIKTNV